MAKRKRIQTEVKSFIKEEGDRVKANELSKKAHFLALTLEGMFKSGQYFKEETQIPDFSKAVEAAKEARDNLMSLEKTRSGPVNTSGVDREQAEKEFIGNAVASTIMVFWCAHGLNGKNRLDAAKEVFQSSVSRNEVIKWGEFKYVLRRECKNYI